MVSVPDYKYSEREEIEMLKLALLRLCNAIKFYYPMCSEYCDDTIKKLKDVEMRYYELKLDRDVSGRGKKIKSASGRSKSSKVKGGQGGDRPW